MTAIYDMDPSTCTIAAAWAHSDLGDPETGPTEFWKTPADDEPIAADRKPRSIARHAGLVAALAAVFGAGAAFGLAVFDFTDGPSPTITLPYVSTQSGVPPGPNQLAPAPVVAAPDNGPKPAVAVPGNISEPKPTASVPVGAPAAGLAPTPDNKPGPVDIVTPPANSPGDAKVTVDIAIPEQPVAVPVPDQPEPPIADAPKPTLQLAPETGPTNLQPVQPPTLIKPRSTLYDPSSQGPKPKSGPATKPSQRAALSKP